MAVQQVGVQQAKMVDLLLALDLYRATELSEETTTASGFASISYEGFSLGYHAVQRECDTCAIRKILTRDVMLGYTYNDRLAVHASEKRLRISAQYPILRDRIDIYTEGLYDHEDMGTYYKVGSEIHVTSNIGLRMYGGETKYPNSAETIEGGVSIVFRF